MGFEMDQEISGVFPVCRFVFQMNFDSVVVCSYLWLLKDNLCCEYRCFHGPSVSPMYVLVSSVGVVTVALYITLCVLQLPCSGHCVLFRQLHGIVGCVLSGCFMMRLLCFFIICCMFSAQL